MRDKFNSFLLLTMESGVKEDADIMGYTMTTVLKWQRKRIITLLIGIIITVILALMDFGIYSAVPMALGVVSYRGKYSKFKNEYEVFDRNRLMDMNRFKTILIPLLYSGKITLHSALHKCHERLPDGAVKSNLERFIVERSDSPGDVRPYIDFAQRSAGNYEADIFMTILFDFHNDNSDMTILNELSEAANEEMFENTTFIMDRKLAFMDKLSLVLVVSLMFLIFGYTGAIILNAIRTMMGGF